VAQSGYTAIVVYHSETPDELPNVANLAVGELAINIADGLIYTKNTADALVTLGGGGGGGGTMASQDADAVAITGGAITGTSLSGPSVTSTGRVLSAKQALSIITSEATLDLSTGDSFTLTVSEAVDIIITGVSASAAQFSYLELVNPGAFAITIASAATVKWVGRALPTWTVSGTDGVVIIANDGSSVTLAASLNIGTPI